MRILVLAAAVVSASACALAAGTLTARTASAQDALPPLTSGQARVVEGQVLQPQRGANDSLIAAPVPGVMVTLHRVGRDDAGPLDSVATDRGGRYRFGYRTVGGDAVYFASVTYGGIAYFTAPFRDSVVQDESADITVFDTTSVHFPLSVRGRHLIVGEIDSTDHRTIIEVFELENDSMRTLVSFDTASSTPTWSAAVPHAALDVRINDAEISPEAFVHRPGRADFYAPFSPGLKQLSFSYRIRASDFPVVFSTAAPVDVFEVLLEESRGTVINEHLVPVDNVVLEGRNFRRFLGQNLAADERVIVDLPTSRPLSGNLYIASLLVVIGAAMLLVLSRAMSRRTPAAARPVTMAAAAPELPVHERLAREIAALDDVYARTANPSDDVREAYQRRRAELRDALAGALAESGVRR